MPGHILTPSELASISPTGAGAGTSGVGGIQTRVLKGDPNKTGLYTIQLTVPANTKIEAHTHPDDRVATVISGTWQIGYGTAFDEKKLKALVPGSFYTEPPNLAHFAQTGNTGGYGADNGLRTNWHNVRGQRTEMKKLFMILALCFSVTMRAQNSNYESHIANSSAVKIHYLKAGTGQKTLVLIHGFGDTSHMWIPLFDEFGKDYTIIAPDMRGLGESSRPTTGYEKKTIASDIHELVKSLGYQKIDLVGHDIGLMVAYAYAAQYSNEVEKLVLLEAPIPGIGDIWQKIYTTPALWHFHFVFSPVALDLVKGQERLFLEHFWQTLSPHPETFSEADRRIYAKAYAQEGAMRSAFEMFKAFDNQDARENRKFAASKLPMPVLTIEGDKAMGGALEVQAKIVASSVTSITLKDTGHWLMEQRPGELKTQLKKFFAN